MKYKVWELWQHLFCNWQCTQESKVYSTDGFTFIIPGAHKHAAQVRQYWNNHSYEFALRTPSIGYIRL